MNKQQALEKLLSIGQSHLLDKFEELNAEKQKKLLDQIHHLHIPTFREQQLLLTPSPHPPIRLLDPIEDSMQAEDGKWYEKGKKAIRQGETGCILIAGGQGSRLGFNGPKGCFPVSVIKKKSLFQLFAEKTHAAGVEAGRPLPLAIMTSPLNHQETVAFFETHQFFGLSPSQVSFFSQKMLPFLDPNGNILFNLNGTIAEGPDGNGSCLRNFYDSGIWDCWYQSGIRSVNTVLVDNPLADPFDAELIGCQCDENADVAIKCTTRRNAEEKVGLIVKHNDHIEIIEYTDIPEESRNARHASGELLYKLANLSLFCFSMDFIKSVAHHDLPLHAAHKAAATLNDPSPKHPNIWKYETFIFDTLKYAIKIKVLIYRREVCFSPLKNNTGQDCLSTVKKALQNRDRTVFYQITGTTPSNKAFELSQQFYYPTQKLITLWKNKTFNNKEYIE